MPKTWMKRYQNWIVGDEPEQCIPIGDGKAESDTVRVVRARTAEEACLKGIAAYNAMLGVENA